MKNNSNLNALALNNVLSKSEMIFIKGGAIAIKNTAGITNNNIGSVVNTNTDDKRRERPGGGITTH
jgi:hypothetical protein